MSASIPTTTSQWELTSPNGISCLELKHNVPLPPLQPNEVLVAIHACSLNSRDNQIVNGTYPWGSQPNTIPLSDCAGSVIAVGASVSRFSIGSRVCPIFHRQWLSGPLRHAQTSALGALEPGVLRRHAVIAEAELVDVPAHLSFDQAATLPCAAVTAWNALFGASAPRTLRPGDVVLTQGSGGVSLFAIQFARVAGAMVIATTGATGGEKERRLRELGASHVLSYKDEDWGEQAKALTPGRRGVDFIVEVSGATEQSTKALQLGGSVCVVGGFADGGVKAWDMRRLIGDLRRAAVGSRSDFEDMNKALELNRIEPVIQTPFEFEDARKAFESAESAQGFGKVVIHIEH